MGKNIITELSTKTKRGFVNASMLDLVEVIGSSADYEKMEEKIYFSHVMDINGKDDVFQRDATASPWATDKTINFFYTAITDIADVIKTAIRNLGPDNGPKEVECVETTISVYYLNDNKRIVIKDGQHRIMQLLQIIVEGKAFPKVPKALASSTREDIVWYKNNLAGLYYDNPLKASISNEIKEIIDDMPIMRISKSDNGYLSFISRNGGVPVNMQVALKSVIAGLPTFKKMQEYLFESGCAGRHFACTQPKNRRDYSAMDAFYIYNYITGENIDDKVDAIANFVKLPLDNNFFDNVCEPMVKLMSKKEAYTLKNGNKIRMSMVIALAKNAFANIHKGKTIMESTYYKVLTNVLKKYKVSVSEYGKYIETYRGNEENLYSLKMMADAKTAVGAAVVTEMTRILDTLVQRKTINDFNTLVKTKIIEKDSSDLVTTMACPLTYCLGFRVQDNGSSGAGKTTKLMCERIGMVGV